MDIQTAIEFFTKEGRVILQAPATFGAAAVILMLGAWAISNYAYSTRIENLEGRLKFKDDQITDYKDKLNGATPEDAKRRIDALELQVKALSPRRLSNEQKQKISILLSGTKGVISIGSDMAVADAKPLAADLASAFQMAKWDVILPMFMGLGNPPATGIGLRFANPKQLSAMDEKVKLALEAGGLGFDMRSEPLAHSWHRGPEPQPDIEIEITNKTN